MILIYRSNSAIFYYFICSVLLFISCNQDITYLDVQGHRGARGLFPENTIEGFRRTIELGISTLELDIAITKDHIPIVYHDFYINPSICLDKNGNNIDNENNTLIYNHTLKEIKTYDCGSLNPNIDRFPEPPRVNIPNEKIPALYEVFDLINEYPNRNIWLNIEIKFHPEKELTAPINIFVNEVIKVIESYNSKNNVNIQSFDWKILETVKSIDPNILTAGLLDYSTIKSLNDSTPSPWLNGIHFENSGGTSLTLLNKAKKYIDIFSPNWKLIDPNNSRFLGISVTEIQNNGFTVIPWTVNRTDVMLQLIEENIDGIITDYPDSLLFLMNKMKIQLK
jgi:glycerophosphoryl diester phosphodiesterase